jgi:hypothetical protein
MTLEYFVYCADSVGPPENCDQPLASSYEALTIIVNVTYPFDGNSVITEYELQYRILPEQWASVKYNASVSQPFIIKNLIPFTLYEVQVQAVNKYAYENNNTSFSNPVRVRTARAGETNSDLCLTSLFF